MPHDYTDLEPVPDPLPPPGPPSSAGLARSELARAVHALDVAAGAHVAGRHEVASDAYRRAVLHLDVAALAARLAALTTGGGR